MLYKRRIERKALFGKILEIQDSYLNADTQPPDIVSPNYSERFTEAEKWDLLLANMKHDYIVWNDEPSTFWLKIAMITYQTSSVFVPVYGWVFWDISIGFYGDGYEYFKAK